MLAHRLGVRICLLGWAELGWNGRRHTLGADCATQVYVPRTASRERQRRRQRQHVARVGCNYASPVTEGGAGGRAACKRGLAGGLSAGRWGTGEDTGALAATKPSRRPWLPQTSATGAVCHLSHCQARYAGRSGGVWAPGAWPGTHKWHLARHRRAHAQCTGRPSDTHGPANRPRGASKSSSYRLPLGRRQHPAER